MTLFVLLAIALAALTLALLVWRRPVAEHVTDPAMAAIAATRPTRGLVVGLALLIALVTLGGYAWVGSPGLLPVTPDAPPGPGPAAEAQTEALQAQAMRNPSDAAGWVQAAQAQLALRHAEVAVQDMRHAQALRPNDANLMADLADALAVLAQGRLDGEPMQWINRALALDPNHVKALALQGSYAMAQRDFRTALTAWNHALQVAQPGDPIAAFLQAQLDDLREMAARAAVPPAAAGSR